VRPSLPPKINAPQHDPRRRAFELGRLIFASGAGFDAFAQARELFFALAGPGARAALEVVHGGGRDRAGNLFAAVLHRKLDDAAVLVVGDEAAAGERHGGLLWRPRVVQLRTPAPISLRSTLWHNPAQQLTSVVMGPGFRQDDGCVYEHCANGDTNWLAVSRRR